MSDSTLALIGSCVAPASVMLSLVFLVKKVQQDIDSIRQRERDHRLDAALASRLERITKDPLLVEAEAEVERFLSGEKQG